MFPESFKTPNSGIGDAFTAHLTNSARVIQAMLDDSHLLAATSKAVAAFTNCLRSGGKLLFCGNGGSAADAQHMAAEYVSRFMYNRPGLPAIALTTDTSILTAIGNDYGFDELFSRQIQALGCRNDVFIAYSTSGASRNIVRGLAEAHSRHLVCVGFTGNRGGPMRESCDILIEVPSSLTPQIQEGHLVLGHIICGVVEQAMFPAVKT